MTHHHCDNCDSYGTWRPIHRRWLCDTCSAEADDNKQPYILDLPALDNIARNLGLFDQ